MTVNDTRTLSALRRRHFKFTLIKVFETLHPGAPALQCGWYIEAMCHALTEAARGNSPRLVITVPPRHLKSITAAVALVAWLLGHDPTLKIMVASYSHGLARLHAQHTRRVLESDWYKRDFPGTRISANGNSLLELVTTAGGGRKAVSVGGSTTGFGADIIIVDDCMKADEARSPTVREQTREWFDGTLVSRLNNKATGIVISIQQRLHEDDLPAHLLEKGYRHLNLPAVAEKDEIIPIGTGRVHHRKVGDLLNPARENQATLDQLRWELGPMVFSAQYQQDPVAPGGNLIQMEWFGTYEGTPERHRFLRVVQSWDTGMTADPSSDFSVCTTWGFEREANKWYLLDVYRQRLNYPDLKRAVNRLWDQWQADWVVIEHAGSGISLGQDFWSERGRRPVMMPATTAKEDRFIGCLAEVEAGNLLLPCEAPWLAAFRSELKVFPNGRNDDQVDSFSQFVNFQRANRFAITREYTADGRPVGRPRPLGRSLRR